MKLVFIRNLNYCQKQQSINNIRVCIDYVCLRARTRTCVLAADPAETHRYFSFLVFLVPYSHFGMCFCSSRGHGRLMFKFLTPDTETQNGVRSGRTTVVHIIPLRR